MSPIRQHKQRQPQQAAPGDVRQDAFEGNEGNEDELVGGWSQYETMNDADRGMLLRRQSWLLVCIKTMTKLVLGFRCSNNTVLFLLTPFVNLHNNV